MLSPPPAGVEATIVDDDGPVLVFTRPVLVGQALMYVWNGRVGDSAVLQPDPSENPVSGRQRRFKLRLSNNKELVARMPVRLQFYYLLAAAKEGARDTGLTRAREERARLPGLLARLDALGTAARGESGGGQFQQTVSDFRNDLGNRIQALAPGAPLPPDIKIVMQALILWSKDSGDQWGEGIWESKELVMTAAEYARVPARQYKCNAYVAEVVYDSVGLVHKAIKHRSSGFFHPHSPPGPTNPIRETGKWFPYQAAQWGNSNQPIPNFPVVTAPKMGDIWSNGTHVGIYLGSYQGLNLYISARDDGDGVFALGTLQHEHGIQIKYLAGGTFRRYTP